MLVATALASGADALVSVDTALGEVPGLAHLVPSAVAIDELLRG